MTVKLPIEIISIENDGYHLIINGKINKKDSLLMIDTGASRSVFNIELLNDENKQDMTIYEDQISAISLTPDEIPSASGIIRELQLQELKIQNYLAAFVDMEHINALYQNNSGKLINGLIGNDLLIKYNAVIDYSNKVLILSY